MICQGCREAADNGGFHHCANGTDIDEEFTHAVPLQGTWCDCKHYPSGALVKHADPR